MKVIDRTIPVPGIPSKEGLRGESLKSSLDSTSRSPFETAGSEVGIWHSRIGNWKLRRLVDRTHHLNHGVGLQHVMQ